MHDGERREDRVREEGKNNFFFLSKKKKTKVKKATAKMCHNARLECEYYTCIGQQYDGNSTLEARELTQGPLVFLVYLISNGFSRIRLTGPTLAKMPYTGRKQRRGNLVDN